MWKSGTKKPSFVHIVVDQLHWLRGTLAAKRVDQFVAQVRNPSTISSQLWSDLRS